MRQQNCRFRGRQLRSPKLKHPQRENFSAPDPTDIDYFSTSEFFVHKALMSFANGSSAGLDGNLPHVLINLTEFSQSLNRSCECDSRRKNTFRTLVVLPWCETNCAKKARWRSLSYRCKQIFPPVIRKCAGYHVFESRQAKYGSRQVGVGTKKGAESASHVFRCLIECPSPEKT